jgi:hypothetical protein
MGEGLRRRIEALKPYQPLGIGIGEINFQPEAVTATCGYEPKRMLLVQITHHAIEVLAVIMACGRWLELRLTPPPAASPVLGSCPHC